MTTLTIEIPQKFEKAITTLINHIGGQTVETNADVANIDDEALTPAEIELFNRALREISLIKDGKLKPIPFSELWKD